MKMELILEGTDEGTSTGVAHSVPLTHSLAMFCMEDKFVLYHQGNYGVISLLFEDSAAILFLNTGEISCVKLGDLRVCLSLGDACELLGGNLVETETGWRFAWWEKHRVILTEELESAEAAILTAAFEIGGDKAAESVKNI